MPCSMDKSQMWISVSYLVLCVNGFTEKRGKEGAQCHSSRAIPAAVLRLPADTSHLGTPASLTAHQQFLGGIIHLSLNTTNTAFLPWFQGDHLLWKLYSNFPITWTTHSQEWQSGGHLFQSPEIQRSIFGKSVSLIIFKEYFLFLSELSHMTIL